MTEENEKSNIKLLILGLENSGKTSILLSLKKETNLLSYFTLKPTKGIKIEELSNKNLNISAWDFGGQKKYREEYLINFNKFSEKAEKLIYIIDVQDFKKYSPALEYLNKLVKILVENEKFIELSIFLHKYDPNLKKQKEFENIDERIDSELINELIEIIPPEIKYKIFKTSIYTIFEKIFIQIK